MKLPIPLRPLLEAVLAAGDAIVSIYQSPFDVTLKEDRSPLTAADKASHELLIAHLAAVSPLPILSEEGKEIPYLERSRWFEFWLVDPLDGTKEFIKKNGEFTVNVALIQNSRPVFGIVYVPVTGVCYFGMKGVGAFRIDRFAEAIEKGASGQDVLLESLSFCTRLPAKGLPLENRPLVIVGSRSHQNEALEDFVRRAKTRHTRVEFVAAGSSLKFCRVAEASADVYPRFGPTMEWDTAAGHAVLSAAGGDVRCMDTGSSLSYNKESLVNPFFIATLTGIGQF